MSSDELIDQQRKEFENPTEWRCRRAFLLKNFNEIPFDRLVCLSHCYVNSSMHGAVYPERVMDEVEQYTRNIDIYIVNGGGGGGHGSGRPQGGSEDRGASASGNKRKAENGARGDRSGDSSEPARKRHALPPPLPSQQDRGSHRPRPLDLDAQLHSAASAPASANAVDNGEDAIVTFPPNLDLTEFYLREIETDDPVLASNPANVLKCSTDFCHRTLDYQFEGGTDGASPVRCRLLVDGHPIASVTGANKAAAKTAVSANVLAALRSRCWTLVVRSDRAFIRAQADAGVARPTNNAASTEAANKKRDNMERGGGDQKIGSENVGHRLLMGMGWSGAGGVGKRLDGRAEPVVGDVRVVSRAGLGAEGVPGPTGVTQAFQSAVDRVLREFQRDREDRDDLFFAADFTNEERKHVHSLCLKLGLASRSYGSSDGIRCLVVSRKRTAAQLVEFVRRNGGSTVRYRLLEPNS